MSKQHAAFQDLIRAAEAAGEQAVADASVVPMVVGTPRNPMASLMGGDGGGFDPNQPTYYVADGVCGFAWVNVKATATEGRKFLNWLKGSVKSSKPFSEVQPASTQAPRADSYYKGVSIWIGGFGQSMQKKEAYGRAFSKVLNEAGIDGLNAYCMSRMD
jgi:hypothetical protein